ncbi:hypothetical protein TSAR_014159 [Trichomalopsis sarcophagae]|uniref:Uncharacterized protein n=1 Tax=Trichomalopsis sarcophagae TaxID=543379 RepID=A0A232EMW9_9HYME|nr:hypothetical protein TSAR_014159 [Trichomalopsis sarcophagae]
MSVQSTSSNAADVVANVIKYAYVRFEDNSGLYVKYIKCIIEKILNPPGKVTFKKFLPKHDEDFDKNKCYYVKWECRKCYVRVAAQSEYSHDRNNYEFRVDETFYLAQFAHAIPLRKKVKKRAT